MNSLDHITSAESEMDSTYERWALRRNRKTEAPDYKDSWAYEQCGECRFWIPLAGKTGLDYGVCTNYRSPRDGRAQFEHDGCDEFVNAGMWITPEDMTY